MSRSYRKNVFISWVGGSSMKAWRTQENRRLRHNAKQIINTCLDYDNLIIPILNDYDTLWGSPNDGCKKLWNKPLLNQCEIDRHERIYSCGWKFKSLFAYVDKNYNGTHYKNCRCYFNKRSPYWKAKRK